MSVIVKGMQMPKACMLCPIYDGEYGECGVLHDRNLFPFLSEDAYKYDTTKEIHKDCPLEERPQGEWNYFAEEMGGIRITGECPNCKQRRIIDNFCSNCGAYLRGNKE